MSTAHVHTAADRIRPILQAMERSIDSARQRREQSRPAPLPRMIPAPVPPLAPLAMPEAATRLKARPKRTA